MAVMLSLSAGEVMAQGKQKGGNKGQGSNQKGGKQGRSSFDPAQAEQRMLERYKERLEIKDEVEWKAIQPLLQRVLEARRVLESHGRGPTDRGPKASQGQRPGAAAGNTEGDVLHKAVDAKAAGAELNTALARYLEWRKTKQDDLLRAQADLRMVLTPRQEAIAVLADLL